MDFYKSVVPAIISLNETSRSNAGRRANVIVASPSMSVILKSMQDQEIGYDADEKFGAVRASSTSKEYSRFTILSSIALTDDRMVLMTKAPVDSEAGVLELTYQPMYVIDETTNSKSKLFIKCRNDIHVIKPETIGVLDVKNVANWLPVLTEA